MTATWQVVKAHLEDRIVSGVYPIGSWLPSVRRMASELNLNRNTVGKIYQAMARDGLLEPVQGKGVRVVARPDRAPSMDRIFLSKLDDVVSEGILLGIPPAALADHFTTSLNKIADNRSIRIAFVECTIEDTRQIADQLCSQLSVPVSPLVLDEILGASSDALNSFDLIATTLFHLQELRSLWTGHNPELIAMHHTVSRESILEIVGLEPGSNILVVGPNSRSVDRIERVVSSYASGEIRTVVIDDATDITNWAYDVDAVVDMTVTHAAVESSAPPEIPIITVRFQIEPDSMEDLRQAVRSVSRGLLGS